MKGFEPSASGSTILRSNQLSYIHHIRDLAGISQVSQLQVNFILYFIFCFFAYLIITCKALFVKC